MTDRLDDVRLERSYVGYGVDFGQHVEADQQQRHVLGRGLHVPLIAQRNQVPLSV